MLAAYQLKGDDISQDGQELTDSDFLTSRIKAELRGGDWQKQFAALHFNVDPNKATQVLIEEQVQSALETGNEEEDLEEFSDIAGFANVIDRAVPEIARGEDPSPMALAALALDKVLLSAEDVEEKAWRELRNGIRSMENWYPKEEQEGEGLITIIRRAPEHRQDALVKNILGTLSSVSIEGSAEELSRNAAQWVDGVLPLVRVFRRRQELLRDTFHVPSDWPAYINAFSHLAGKEGAQEVAPFFVPSDSLEPDGVDVALADMVSDDSVGSAHLKGIKLMKLVEPMVVPNKLCN